MVCRVRMRCPGLCDVDESSKFPPGLTEQCEVCITARWFLFRVLYLLTFELRERCGFFVVEIRNRSLRRSHLAHPVLMLDVDDVLAIFARRVLCERTAGASPAIARRAAIDFVFLRDDVRLFRGALVSPLLCPQRR